MAMLNKGGIRGVLKGVAYPGTRLTASCRMLFASALTLLLLLGIACSDGPTATPTESAQSPSPISPTATPTATPVPGPTSTSIPSASEPTPTAMSGTPQAPTATATMAPGPTAAPPAFPVVITDSNGNDVVFDAPPERIIAYDSVVVEILFAMGEGSRIAGTHDFVTYPPEADSVPRVGDAFNANTEKILEANPDLIYVFFASSYDQVKDLGIKVLYLESPSALDGIPERIRMWGRITGNMEGAETVAAQYEARLSEVTDKLSSLEQGPRLYYDLSGYWTVGPDTILGEVFGLLKAENIAHDLSGYIQISPEVVVERDPEVIIASPEQVQEFRDDPAFQGVSAVMNGRLHSVGPPVSLSVFGPRFIEGIEALAKIVHPDIFGPPPVVFPIAVKDSNGNDVVFDAPPERIVAMNSVVVEILFALGEGHRIVATHDFVTYPPEADSVPRVGSAFAINAEQILALDPDLIAVFFASAYEQVKDLGIKVLYIDSPITLDGIPDRMRLWGRITGNVEGAAKLATDFNARLDAVLESLASLEQGPRLFHDDSLFFTRGPDTVLGQVYELLKVENIAHDISGYGQLTPEAIVERDPEVIISTFATRVQEFLDDPAFQDVSAVKNGRVYVIQPDGIVSVFGTRFIEGIEALARLIYPDQFGAIKYDPSGPDRDCSDFDTWQEAQVFYKAAGGPDQDPHRLDSDGNGIPCESLPGAP